MENRKRKYRSTRCAVKSDALNVLEQWKKEDEDKRSGDLESLTTDFFIPGRCHYRQWRSLKPQTIQEHKRNLKIITEKYKRPPLELQAGDLFRTLQMLISKLLITRQEKFSQLAHICRY